MWNWLSFSSVSVSYSISYSFQRALHTLKWVLFLQVIFEILTFYFGFHSFHVYSHRHMYIHSVMCTSACKYMYINIPPFTCCFLLQLFSTSLLPCRQVMARVCQPLLVLALQGSSGEFGGSRRMATSEISLWWYLQGKPSLPFCGWDRHLEEGPRVIPCHH